MNLCPVILDRHILAVNRSALSKSLFESAGNSAQTIFSSGNLDSSVSLDAVSAADRPTRHTWLLYTVRFYEA